MVAGCGPSCIKYFLFFFNVLFLLFGLVLMAMGAYALIMVVSLAKSTNPNETAHLSEVFILGAIVFLVAGGVLVFICFFGCCGAIKEVKCMLGTYAVLLGIVIIVELVFVVRLFMIKGLIAGITKDFQVFTTQALDEYTGEDDGGIGSLDYHHQANQCCGGDSYTDFKKKANKWRYRNVYEIPLSCCILNSDKTSDIQISDLQDPNCYKKPTSLNSYIDNPCDKKLKNLNSPELLYDIVIGVCFGLIALEVALTTDGWTSCATDSYLTITSSHINIRWEIINFVLQTRVLNESHTAVHIAEVLQEAATEWHIPTTEGYPPVTTDNAANVTKAVSLCESILHVPCLAHTLNLAVQKSLKVNRVSHVMAKVRRIVAFFHRSPMASSLLKEKALLLTLPAHDLIIDVMTRWNSAFDMLSRYLEMQAAVVTVLLGKDLSKAKGDLPALTDTEAQLAEEVVNFLKPMKHMTTLLCSEGSPTVSVIMPLKHHLLEVALKHCDEDSPTVREMKEIMVADIKPRYTSQAEMLYCASAVDPRFKNLPFLSDVERYDVYKNVTTKVADVLQKRAEVVAIKLEPEDTPALPVLPEYPDPPKIETESGDAPDTTSTLTVREEPQQKHCSKTKPDKGQKEETKTLLEGILGEVFVVSSEPAKSPFELAKLDVDQYQNEVPISVGNNPLLWWRVNEYKFPRLSLLAKKVLCIPATSVPSERAFSTAGDILSPTRASMNPENLDMLLFLKKNLQ